MVGSKSDGLLLVNGHDSANPTAHAKVSQVKQVSFYA